MLIEWCFSRDSARPIQRVRWGRLVGIRERTHIPSGLVISAAVVALIHRIAVSQCDVATVAIVGNRGHGQARKLPKVLFKEGTCTTATQASRISHKRPRTALAQNRIMEREAIQ